MLAIDPQLYELYFECPRCKPLLGLFQCRVSDNEKSVLTPEYMPFRCARGHKQTWTSYRGYAKIDSSGYIIDRHHELWKQELGLRQGELDALDQEYLGRPKC